MEGLASHFLVNRSGRCDVSSTDRIFLQLACEWHLVRWTRRRALRGGTGLHRFRDSFKDDPDDALQHGNRHHREKKIEYSAKHYFERRRERATPLLFYLRKQLLFFGRGFAGGVDAGLCVARGNERRRDVDAQSGIDHRVLGMF